VETQPEQNKTGNRKYLGMGIRQDSWGGNKRWPKEKNAEAKQT